MSNQMYECLRSSVGSGKLGRALSFIARRQVDVFGAEQSCVDVNGVVYSGRRNKAESLASAKEYVSCLTKATSDQHTWQERQDEDSQGVKRGERTWSSRLGKRNRVVGFSS